MNAGAAKTQWWKYLVVLTALACIAGVAVYWSQPAVETLPSPAELPGFEIPNAPVSLTHTQLETECHRAVEQLRQDYPNRAAALHTAAYCLAQCGSKQQAIELYRQCLAMDKPPAVAQVELARLLRESGDTNQALQYLQQAAGDKKVSAVVFAELVISLLESGKLKEAVEAGRRGTELFPRDAELWRQLGRAYMQQSQLQEAKNCFETSIKLNPELAASYFALADALRQQGKTAAAAQYAAMYGEKSGASDTSPKPTQTQVLRQNTALALLAIAKHYESDDPVQFINLCQRAAELAPGQMLAYHMAAGQYIKSGNVRQSMLLHKHLIQAEPTRAANYLNLAALYGQLRKPEQVDATLAAGVEHCPSDAVLRDTFALFLLEADRLEASRTQMEQAIRIEPSSQRYQTLAIICDRLGDKEAANIARTRAGS